MKVILIAPTRTSLDIVLHLSQSLFRKTFFLYTPYVSEYYRRMISGRKNILLVDNIIGLIPIIEDAECLITLGCSLHAQHKTSAFISVIFKSLSKPRFDIQHGLFQPGISLGDPREKSSETTILTDNIIRWSEYGIPLSRRNARISGRNILVTSNLHWGLYSEQDRSLFKRCVLNLARSFPEFNIVWRAHPAEFEYSAGEYPKLPFGYPEAENIRYLTFQEIENYSVGQSIRESMLLFTSPSTAIVDAEQHGLPSIIFDASALSGALRTLAYANLVRRPEEIVATAADILGGRRAGLTASGMNFGFAADKFESLLQSEISNRAASAPPSDDIVKALELFLEKASLFGVRVHD